MKRGEVWYCRLGEGEGSEQEGWRPVLILQNDIGNRMSPNTIVACITDFKKPHLPTHVGVEAFEGIRKYSTVMLEQLRTVSKTRLSNQIAVLPPKLMQEVERALKLSLGVG